ncbi:hypothetical protein Slin14017_G062820 [Septoria linicola]|nr:hypothetical protein Slin14017_G062820 [Septoria linicola]
MYGQNAIDIDEPEIVLVQVLRYLYGLDLKIGWDGPVVLARDVVSLYLNMEKYEIPGLATEVHRAIVKEVEGMACHGVYHSLVSFGLKLYWSRDRRVVPEAISQELILCTIQVLDNLIEDDAWGLVICHKNYVTDIVTYLVKTRRNIAEA